MSAASERRVELHGGFEARVLEQGSGEPVGYLAGLYGLPRWIPFLDRLAESRRVIAPSLPGFPGATGLRELDDLADWVTTTLDLLEASGLDGADLVASSVGAALAAEVAAFSRTTVRRLVLISPLGLFDENEPSADIWALRPRHQPALVAAQPDKIAALLAPPEDANEVSQISQIEWQIEMRRAQEASARLLWPTGDLGLVKRLHRIDAPTLLVLGAEDRVLPASYAKRFAEGISGPVELRSIEGAGHVAEIDRPDAVADAVLAFLAS